MKPLLVSLSLVLGVGTAAAATPVGSGYTQPVFLTAPTGDSRLFVVEKAGLIKVQQGGSVSTWLDISTQVDTAGERGLLGLAFDPGFASNGRFYVDYIDKTTLNTVVASYTVNASGAVDTGSAKTILTVAQAAGRSNHKAGWIGFNAADPGNLYIATGDGGSSNDPDNNAQNLDSNLGKLLRVTPGSNGGYTVPTDNPFVGVAGNDEIWAYGLRNPYRNSFDRQTGDLWIGDVGQGAREEVNFAAAASGLGRGANYGWRVREGTIATPGIGDPTPPNLTEPLFDYGRDVGGTVIGGYVYRGADASLNGKYVFGDYVTGDIWSYSGGTRTALDSPFGGFQLTSFGEGGDGSLYAVGIDGNIYLLAAAVPEPASALLLALGLAAGLLTRRRRS
ncbi:glucose/arabinose dehydrogenase [Pelomonas aquatica]|uniref:Glucose/arabinose dehydrogenase n=1 Tax=Pelomonas aquatica TaxID=431058 RepID=A0ABU1ZEX6_9BURK|nr:PQQ-dependent sugar dehydrogenase [Pelomonas aquatica]MDR7299182.1 glucose/arabinose dehydrogenase [Pelomonas aquatica]